MKSLIVKSFILIMPLNLAANALFAPAVLYNSGGSFTNSISVANFNQDGNLDLVATNVNSDNISVFFNDGFGSFPIRIDYPVGDGPWSVCTSDLDLDGDIDLAVACHIADKIYLLFNDGDGSFPIMNSHNVGDGPISIICADIDNNDSAVELITANFYSNNVSVLLNNGVGGFSNALHYPAGLGSRVVTASDLNGDGLIDLAVANTLSYTVSVLFNSGNAIFQDPVNYEVGNDPHSVSSEDLDGDGDIDLFCANHNSGDVSVLENMSDETFADEIRFAVAGNPVWGASSDFNGDGLMDLAFSDYSSQIAILYGTGDLSFLAADYYSALASRPARFAVCDLDNNGAPDLASANDGSNNISVLLNQRPPRILSTIPLMDETNAPVNTNISILFDIDMDQTTFTDSTIIVDGMISGNHLGFINYNTDTRTLNFDPTTDFTFQELVFVTIHQSAKSTLGQPLDSTFFWTFTIADCCTGARGDLNHDGTDANILDLTYMVDFIFRGGPEAGCPNEADVNSDGDSANILDLTFLVDRIFRGGPAPGACI